MSQEGMETSTGIRKFIEKRNDENSSDNGIPTETYLSLMFSAKFILSIF